MSISYPKNLDEKLNKFSKEDQNSIKLAYNMEFNEKLDYLKKKTKSEFKKIQDNNFHHSMLHSTFLKPFISDKTISPFNELEKFSLFLIEPLYSISTLKNIPTFDSLIGKTEKDVIHSLYLIEVKSQREVDNSYTDFKKYYSKEIKKLLIETIKKKFPHLSIDIDKVYLFFVIIVENKHRSKWIQSLTSTNEPIFLFAREKIQQKSTFKLVWKPTQKIEGSEGLSEIEQFFQNNPQLDALEFQMSYSLDNLYNLRFILNDFSLSYGTKILEKSLVIKFLKEKMKYQFIEDIGIVDKFYSELLKIGIDHDVIYQKNLGGTYFIREFSDLEQNFIKRKISQELIENDANKSEILNAVINKNESI